MELVQVVSGSVIALFHLPRLFLKGMACRLRPRPRRRLSTRIIALGSFWYNSCAILLAWRPIRRIGLEAIIVYILGGYWGVASTPGIY